MRIVTRVAALLQSVLGTEAERLARECGVIQRQRKFTGATLAQMLVLGFLHKPNASSEDLAQTASLCGVSVSRQAVDQRFTAPLATFMEKLWQVAVAQVLSASAALVPLLQRFEGVFLLDSTTISLPPALQDRFPGCGGLPGAGQAAIKLQVLWDLLSGCLHRIIPEAGRDCDVKSSAQSVPLPRRALRIADLGYFSLPVLSELIRAGVDWISRIQSGTSVFAPDGTPRNLLQWLADEWRGEPLDGPILLGASEKLPCRLLAWRVPEEVANRRRQKLRAEAKRKGRTPSSDRLLWCEWMVLVTSVEADRLTWQEAVALYRARWQIELLFKLWKSHGLIAELTGSTLEQQLVRFWSRLLAVLLQHWLLLCTVWGDTRHSLVKAARAIRAFSRTIAAALKRPETLIDVLEDLARSLTSVARRDKRRKPGTWQLLLEPDLLDYTLT